MPQDPTLPPDHVSSSPAGAAGHAADRAAPAGGAKTPDAASWAPPGGAEDGPSYRIGEVARRSGTTARTIRYYEELGLLGGSADRPKGGHRLYTAADVTRLREVVRLRDLLGLSLEELVKLTEAEQARECLRARWESTSDDAERAGILQASIPLVERQLELVRTRQRNLEDFERELAEKLELMQRRLGELGSATAAVAG
jgi:MerR family transcriptional regulator, repressor of the yfmOP operon